MCWWVKLGVLIVLCHYSDGQCQVSKAGFNLFGPNCEYLCHCQNGAACDATTGYCLNSCAGGWMGPGCQYRDIAIHEISRHLDNTNRQQWAYMANDGNPATCSETDVSSAGARRTEAPYWRVYFPNQENVRGLIITTTNTNDFSRGFKITVETIPDISKTDKLYYPPASDVSTCYEHMLGSTLNHTFEIYCDGNKVGNQVRIQLSNKDTQLTLCDVNIFGGRNVAFGKNADESSPMNSASLAVDGKTETSDRNKCSSTGSVNNPSWWLDLGHQYMVYTIQIFAITGHISNFVLDAKTNGQSKLAILHDSRGSPLPTANISVSKNLSYVRVMRPSMANTILSICEVQIFGDCPNYQCGFDCSNVCHCKTFRYSTQATGTCISDCEGRWTGSNGKCDRECSVKKWGELCEEDCGHCKDDEPCNVIDGRCPTGCDSGYQTPGCTDECLPGHYGDRCTLQCSPTCKDIMQCHNVDGSCTGGCKPGWKGPLCKEACNLGKYGDDCSFICSQACKDHWRCHNVNGSCSGGCEPGWTGDLCKQECTLGRYGDDCTSACSQTCKDPRRCHNVNGSCSGGCKPGWRGDLCTQECSPGYYGLKCEAKCSTHCRLSCYHTNGVCHGGCSPGWQFLDCNTECFPGHYGDRCTLQCSPTCKDIMQCHNVDGSCTGGCKPGWKGPLCKEACDVGKYGVDCTLMCSKTCKDIMQCHNVDGSCTGGCKPGWKGPLCKEECTNGFFGENCIKKCSDNCKSVINECHHVNGSCYDGCKPGWKGDLCKKACDAGTYGDDCTLMCSKTCNDVMLCDNVDGSCSGGCKPGWEGVLCQNRCTDGFYGSSCSGKCSSNCRGGVEHCHHIHGECTQNCTAGWKDQRCDTACDPGTYGDDCTLMCSQTCRDNRQCHNVNGSCSGGCTLGWEGGLCKKKCTHGFYGRGCFEKCSSNCRGGVEHCDHINGVCTQNCTAGWKGRRCTTACDAGTYGDDCTLMCSKTCNDVMLCDNVDGSCSGGCKRGWEGVLCQTRCTHGFYGRGCSGKCSSNCRGGVEHCHHINGECTQNCTNGWRGRRCKTECNIGSFGEGCSKECSDNCNPNSKGCHHVNGSCYDGCKPGWKGYLCNEKCSGGSYGKRCEQQCSRNCRGGLAYCDHVTGTCTHNCSDGWLGSHCNDACEAGYFGDACIHECSGNCLHDNSTCDHVNGHCERGCAVGWTGNTCSEACRTGFYGLNCTSECSTNCEENCNHTNGVCHGGCSPGWQGLTCEIECLPGHYGDRCTLQCSPTCKDVMQCHNVNGSCTEGCKPGWKGPLCKEECPDGNHGFDCSEECGNCAGGAACDKANGSCLQGCSDDFTGMYCLQQLKKQDQPTPPMATFIGVIVAAALAICVTVLIIFMYRRRKTRERRSPSPGPDIPDSKRKRDIIYENGIAFQNTSYDVNDTQQNDGNVNTIENIENVYYNDMEGLAPKTAIYLSGLKEYVVTHSNSSKLQDEFVSIPYGLQYPTTAALKPANRSKNRYKDVYPYDHSRVLLDTSYGGSDSDYINACYIDGHKKERAYIATQGPTNNNVADFWRMIWEKNVGTIVMVTNPVEKGKMKCIEYWKNKDDELKFNVTVTSEETFDMMIVRHIQFTLASYEGSKTVTQFHFTAWPDKSTPDGPTGLVQFFLKCRKNYINKVSPIVVHCSAGVGRTGTFIALDYLYEQGKDLGYVDVYGVVQKLRQQRVNAVQTKGQYVFLHEVVHEAVVLPSPVNTLQFPETYTKLLQVNKATGKVRLQEQYEDIADVLLSQETRNKMNDITEDGDDFSASKDPENEKRNRYADILVSNKFRPFLSTSVEGCNNYINAVFVQSHRDSHGFLLSQAPMAYTAVDYCRLILDRSLTCIVSFDYEQVKQNERYLPSKGKLTIGPFDTFLDSKEDNGDFMLNCHRLVYKNKTLDVQHLVYKDWPAGQKVPSNMTSFLKLVEAVQVIQRSIEGPILVHCLNGAEKCGMFVVLLNVIERLRVDQDIAIPQTIRLTRRRRQQIVPNYEQYRFCHDVMMHHVEENSTYANV